MTRQTIAVVAIILFAIMATSAQATPPIDVNFEFSSCWAGDPEPFVASGPAVDDGLVCESGTVVEVFATVVGIREAGFNLRATQLFTCDDGSGEFLVNLQARIDYRRGITFHWNVLSGTEAYADLRGAGSGIGLGTFEADCVFHIYEGALHTN